MQMVPQYVVARAVVQVTHPADTVVQAVPACHVREVAVVLDQAIVLIPAAAVIVAVVAAVPVAVVAAVPVAAVVAVVVAVAHEDKAKTSLQCCLNFSKLYDL